MVLERATIEEIFFFSSRRRHTRCSRDWSSDVCSSDLDCLSADALTKCVLLCPEELTRRALEALRGRSLAQAREESRTDKLSEPLGQMLAQEVDERPHRG